MSSIGSNSKNFKLGSKCMLYCKVRGTTLLCFQAFFFGRPTAQAYREGKSRFAVENG